MRDMYEELEETTGRIMAALSDDSPKLLSVVETEKGQLSEILEFLGKIVNCGYSSPYIPPLNNIDKYLPTHRIYFGYKSIEVRGPMGQRYAGIVTVREYCPTTSAGMMDGFLKTPFEFIISQSFVFTNRQVAISQGHLMKFF